MWLRTISRICLGTISLGIMTLGMVSLAGCHSESQSSADVADSKAAGEHSAAKDPEPNPEARSARDHAAADRPSGPTPPLHGWDAPALAVVLTGETFGYLEPCGCTERQSGGLSRRADLFRQIREKGWPVTAFDLGGTVERNRRQSEIKFATLLAALKDMDYQAMALGAKELRLDPDFLITQIPDSRFPECELPFVSANVRFGSGLEDLGPARSKLVTVNDVTIGVTGILGKNLQATIAPRGSNLAEKFAIDDPADVLPEVIDELNSHEPDVLLLLSHTSLKESRELARQFPQFDVIVSAGGPEDPSGRPETIGETLLLTVGKKGKHAGVLGFYPEDPEQRFRFEVVELDKDTFNDTQQMIEHMADYQERLRVEQIAALEPPISHPSGAEFVGAKKCGECHTKAYKKWKSTYHAHGYESLFHDTPRAKERLKGIDRNYDAECLACHVTGWAPQEVLRYETGFINEEFAQTEEQKERSQMLRGNQCENCHGPGSRHIELMNEFLLTEDAETRQKGLQEVRVTLAEARESLCYKCHDLDNSPNFDFDTYWPKIEHPWRD